MKLDQLSLRTFLKELGSGSATPGGGSVAALCGAMGAALSAMVARLTVGKQAFRNAWEGMRRVQEEADGLAERFLVLAQQDTDAYREVIAALKLPRESEGEKSYREEARQKAMKRAASVPLDTLRLCERLIGIAQEAVEHGTPVTLTDAGAAVHLAHAAARVAAYNVRINLATLKDNAFVEGYKREVEEILGRMEPLLSAADGYVRAQLP